MGLMDSVRWAWRRTLQPRYEARASKRREVVREERFRQRDHDLDREAVEFLRSLHPEKAPEMVLVGGETDGGYFVPSLDLTNYKLFSPGVGHVVDFEYEFASQGHDVFMLDGTVQQLPKEHEKFNFVSKNLGMASGEISLGDWISEHAESGEEVVLQMDIEGAEWEAFSLDAIDDEILDSIAWMVVEFHGMEDFWKDSHRPKMLGTVARILENHFPAAVHPNNCAPWLSLTGIHLPRVFEVTFVNRRYAPLAAEANVQFPRFRNCPNRPSLVWPFSAEKS